MHDREPNTVEWGMDQSPEKKRLIAKYLERLRQAQRAQAERDVVARFYQPLRKRPR